jgi:hypothetical protein
MQDSISWQQASDSERQRIEKFDLHMDKLNVGAVRRAAQMRAKRLQRRHQIELALLEILADTDPIPMQMVIIALRNRSDTIPFALTPSGKLNGITKDARDAQGIRAYPVRYDRLTQTLQRYTTPIGGVSVWSRLPTIRDVVLALKDLQQQEEEIRRMT